MTVNYKNSAGTDLDSVFYINNGNAGAIGFKTSDGQDLGNRYVSGSLGYNVGYKNSAGTDIGYLRGASPPALRIGSVSFSVDQYGKFKASGSFSGGVAPYEVYFGASAGGKSVSTSKKMTSSGSFSLTTKALTVSGGYSSANCSVTVYDAEDKSVNYKKTISW